jgi:hypothetical protein
MLGDKLYLVNKNSTAHIIISGTTTCTKPLVPSIAIGEIDPIGTGLGWQKHLWLLTSYSESYAIRA